ncbi:TNF receptor-associated factor 4 isoform X2 [Harpegnathos saltator]|uniref:TNF receptor-associated factor 4 isoform X2 n=2 Tax=Harpegnathos saltator TaxID=610380 RepID=UPI000DBEEAD8|nr:TNF receptor-associated factor 4 isoform X2 [Harpegnathos saltator]
MYVGAEISCRLTLAARERRRCDISNRSDLKIQDSTTTSYGRTKERGRPAPRVSSSFAEEHDKKPRKTAGSPLVAKTRECYQQRTRVTSVVRVTLVPLTKMVRGLSQWTKTLSFPVRVSPQRSAKESKGFHVSPSASPTSPPSPINDTMDKSPIITDENLQDSEAEKTIMGSIVYCIHYKDGCKWSDELRKLKAHLNTCKHDAVPCGNKCGAMIPRVLMEDHLKYTCAQRRARCDFCAKEFTGHTLEKHTGTCGYEPLYCENKCGMKVQRRHLGQHKLGECAKRLVACRYCNKEFVFDTLGAHHAKCGRFPVACPHRCETAVLPREDLEVHLKDHCTTHLLSCTFKDAGCRFKGNRFSLDKHLEESTKMHLSLMCSLVTKQQHQITSLKSAISKLSLNYTGTLIWKITDYASKMSEAKAKEGMELISPPFYTSQYGYKLQASIFLNGNGTGEGSHISIYIKILPGEYDALLRWPFSHSVSFTMFDQTVVAEKACNIVESFIPDPTWKNFQRPSREPDSLGFGFPRFVSHEMVKKRHFVKDDTMFIRVKVDPSKIVAV